MKRLGPAETPDQPLKKIKYLEINADSKVATHDVIMRAHRDDVDILIIGESNRRICKRNAWLEDDRVDAAIVLINGDIVTHNRGRGAGFV